MSGRLALSVLNSKIQTPRVLLLLSFDWIRDKDPVMPLGHASILSHLRARQVNVVGRSWSVQSGLSINEVVDYVAANDGNNVDLGIGAFIWNESYLHKIMQEVRNQGFKGRIILGGSQVSYTKQGLESYYPLANVFIRGYAEDALASLMLSPQAYPVIPGVHFAGHPDLGNSATADLEKLSSPFLTGIIKPQPFMRWETQRGCPFRCGFCQHRESDITMTRRQFSQSRIMREIDFFLSNPVIQDIAVLDPIFNSGPSYMNVLQRFAKGKYSGKLALQCRIEMVRPEFLDAVQQINQTGKVVLEFGLQTIHREEEVYIQRPNNMAKVREVLAETHKRGIMTEVSLIFGLPGQTVASFQKTIDFCKEMQVPTIFAYPLRLHRGTPLYEDRKKLGLIESTDEDLVRLSLLDEDHIGHVVASPTFTRADWQEMAIRAKSLDDYNSRNLKAGSVQAMKMENTLRYTLWHTAKPIERESFMGISEVESFASTGVKPQN